MIAKTFELHFRYRDSRNELFDVFENIETGSLAKAKVAGKAIAAERAPDHSGKYWFVSASAKEGQ